MSTKLSFSCYSTFQYYGSGNQFAWLDVECLRYIRRDTCTLRKICHLKGCLFVCLFWYFTIFKRIFYLHQTSLNDNDIPIIIDDKQRLYHQALLKGSFRLYRTLLMQSHYDITSSHHPRPTKIILLGKYYLIQPD